VIHLIFPNIPIHFNKHIGVGLFRRFRRFTDIQSNIVGGNRTGYILLRFTFLKDL